MDRRQKKTRQAVYQAFTSLLEEKSYSNITVQEIIDRANIGRSTFYAHFETKDELLKALCAEIFEHVFSEHLAKERTHDFSGGEGKIRAEITHILYHRRDSAGFLRGILACESGEMFMRYFKEYMEQVFEGELGKRDLGLPREYLLNHTVCDFAETVRWWIKHAQYSPEEISEFFFKTAPLA